MQADPWLPLHPPRAPALTTLATESHQVANLLHSHGNGWNEAKVRELIHADDVDKVLAIKVCSSASEDYLGWHYTKSGLYTVKSAYWLANQTQLAQIINPPPGNTRLKAATWKLKTAPKIKHFIWRILSKAIATGENLRRRRINNASLCRRCCHEEETAKHLFFDCFYAQSIWRASGFSHQSLIDPTTSFEDKMNVLLSASLAGFNPQIHQLGLWILWRIWKSRNLLVFQQKALSWQSTLALAKNDGREWLAAQEYLHQIHEPAANDIPIRPPSLTLRWQKPPPGWLKCNFVGSFANSLTPSRAGCLFRDERGNFKGAGRGIGNITSTAFESEWQAWVFAMQHAWTKGFEGDNKNMFEILNHKLLHFSSLNWLREVKHWKLKFEEVNFIWTPRVKYQPADQLAKFNDLSLFQSFSYVPLMIHNSIHNDFVSSFSC